MRVLVDYRPALRQRTGVGEYIHELVRAFAEQGSDQVSIFTASWKDRPSSHLSAELGARVVDRRLPGRLLNALWHRAGWPPVEWLSGPTDVVHAAHPLLIPSRSAAQVVTIHDLFFLDGAASLAPEIRRDYPALAGAHAGRAHAVVTSSHYGKRQVVERLNVPADRVYVVSPGAPRWRALGRAPSVPVDGYALFVGTLEPRKNVGALLDVWTRLLEVQAPQRRRLVLAGGASDAASGWLSRIAAAPLAGSVEYRGYVPDSEREALYAGARVLILPSLEEGFGLPVLEAMSAGVPVVATTRGSVPEVAGEAAVLVDPLDLDGMTEALARVLTDDAHARDLADRGLERARAFSWGRSAALLRTVYLDALGRRAREGRAA